MNKQINIITSHITMIIPYKQKFWQVVIFGKIGPFAAAGNNSVISIIITCSW